MAKDKEIITIIAPNGQELEEKFHPHDTVGKTLKQAVKELAKGGHIDPSVEYVLVLGEAPLEPSLTLEAVGVMDGSRLKIRTKAIPGDGNAFGVV